MHRTILVVDVERFGSPMRNDRDRIAIRTDLCRVLTAALAAAATFDGMHCSDGAAVRKKIAES